MTLFRLRHADENRLALFVAFARSQVAINTRGLHFGAPVFQNDFDCFFLQSLSHREDTREDLGRMPGVVERPAGNVLALIERTSTKSLGLGHDEACPSSLRLICIIVAVLEGGASPAPKLFPKLGFKVFVIRF